MYIELEVKTLTLKDEKYVRLDDYEKLLKKYKALKNKDKKYEEEMLDGGEKR